MTAVGAERDRRDRLTRELQRYRARMITVAGSRYAASAIVVALAVAVSVSLTWRLHAPVAGGLGAALVAVAALLSFIAASMSAPSLAQTASRLDRRLGSNDCLVTAVECLGASDPVADLVVCEGLRRVESSTPSTLLPLELPQRIGMLSAVASTIVAASIIGWNRSTITAGADAPSTSPVGATPAAERSVPNGRGQQQRPANPQEASVTASASPRAVAGAPEPTADRSRAADNDSAAAKSGSESSRGTTADRSSALPTDPSRAPNESASSANTDRNATTAAGGSRSDRPSARGDRDIASGAQIGSGGGGRSATLASQTSRGAGGVSGGSLSTAPTVDRASAPPSTQSAAQMDEAAWTRAQAAIARERIPADLRQLVQDYFTAIRRARR